MLAGMIRKTTLSLLHRMVDRPPFSGRSALLEVSRQIGRGATDVRLRPGFLFSLDLNQPYHLMIFAGDYESQVLRTIRRVVKPGDMFVDGGANLGLHSLTAATCVGDAGHVWAFEPDPIAYPIVRANLDLNPDLRARVSLFSEALSRRTEELSLVQEGYSQVQSHAVRAQSGESAGSATGNVTVKACRLDDVVPKDRTSPVAAMKIDIEGFEMEALAGAEAYLARPDVIVICELNDRMLRKAGASADELIGHFHQRGFASRTIEGDPLERHDPAWPEYKNGIFYRGAEATRRVDAALRSPGN
jgi:FkbM family methyltransferase